MPEVQSALRALEQGTYNRKSAGQLLWWSYYDRNLLATGGTSYSFFSVGLGPAKNLDVTNFPNSGGEIPQAQNFEVRAFELYFVPAAAVSQAELQLIQTGLATGYFEFTISNQAPSLQLPLTQFFSSSFPIVVTGGAAGDQFTGRSQYNGVWESPVEIILAAKTNFTCNINFTAGLNAVFDGCKLFVAMVGGLVRLT